MREEYFQRYCPYHLPNIDFVESATETDESQCWPCFRFQFTNMFRNVVQRYQSGQ